VASSDSRVKTATQHPTEQERSVHSAAQGDLPSVVQADPLSAAKPVAPARLCEGAIEVLAPSEESWRTLATNGAIVAGTRIRTDFKRQV